MKTRRTSKGLERLKDRIERGMVWRYNLHGGSSYEVTEESVQLRRLEREERKRAIERRRGKRSKWIRPRA